MDTEPSKTVALYEDKSFTNFMVITFLEVENKYDNIISYCLFINLNLLTLERGKRVDTWIRRFVVCIGKVPLHCFSMVLFITSAKQSGTNV